MKLPDEIHLQNEAAWAALMVWTTVCILLGVMIGLAIGLSF